MWLMLALAVVVCVAVLYVPGYLFARSLFVSRFASVAIAPMISIFFLAVLGIVLFEVGVTCSGPVLLAIAVAIGAIALLVSKGIARAKAPNASRELIAIDDVKGAWKAAALYVAVAFAVVFVVFLLAIDGPESFSRNDGTSRLCEDSWTRARSPRCMRARTSIRASPARSILRLGMRSRRSWRLSSAMP